MAIRREGLRLIDHAVTCTPLDRLGLIGGMIHKITENHDNRIEGYIVGDQGCLSGWFRLNWNLDADERRSVAGLPPRGFWPADKPPLYIATMQIDLICGRVSAKVMARNQARMLRKYGCIIDETKFIQSGLPWHIPIQDNLGERIGIAEFLGEDDCPDLKEKMDRARELGTEDFLDFPPPMG